MAIPNEFKNVTAVAKANVYFDAKVVSHTIFLQDGSKKTLGLINPGKYHFGTDKAERMEIVAGNCRVKLDGKPEEKTYSAGQVFEVPAKSGFDIDVKMASMMKDVNSKLKVCFVGPPVTVDADKILRTTPAIDFVVRREFDYPIVQLTPCMMS